MMRTLILVFLLGGLISCGDPVERDNSDPIVASYSMQCAGNQKFRESEVDSICEVLASDHHNKGCDQDFREKLFNELCPLKNFPHKTTPRSYMSIWSYELDGTNCTTGKHFYYFADPNQLHKIRCLDLVHESKNNNCARSDRYKLSRKLGC
jgi:hypothetical protein